MPDWSNLMVKPRKILVEQQPPQGAFACDHSGLAINKFSLEDVTSTLVAKTVDLMQLPLATKALIQLSALRAPSPATYCRGPAN